MQKHDGPKSTPSTNRSTVTFAFVNCPHYKAHHSLCQGKFSFSNPAASTCSATKPPRRFCDKKQLAMTPSPSPNPSAQNLQFWREHPHASRWNLNYGDQLNDARLQIVHDFAGRLASTDNVENLPPWMRDFIAHCARDVPFYRARLKTIDENALQVLAGRDWQNLWQKIGFALG